MAAGIRGGIYALDLNSTVGFAIEQRDRPPVLGKQHFPRKNANESGKQGLAYMKWLRNEFEVWQPARVIYEAPLPPMRQSQTHTATVTMGFANVTEIVCAAFGLPVSQVSAGTWCKAFTGSGKRDSNTKGRVLVECARRGFDPPDDNAADGLGILAYAIGLYFPHDEARNAAVGNPTSL